MKSGIRTGLVFVGGSIATLIINDVYPLAKAYIINKTVPSISSLNPLWFVEITAFCVMGLGVFFILKEKYGLKKSKVQELSTNQERTNDNIIVEIKDKYWYPPEKEFNSVFYTIYVKTLLKNTGDRDTAIHTVSISFDYKGILRDYVNIIQNEIKMYSGDSKNQDFTFTINEKNIQIDSTLRDVKFTIEHTYDKVEKIIREIPKLHDRHF